MITANILMKHSASTCNKELLSYLHENINRINRNYNLKVVIVYNEMLPKLKNRISSLPALLIGDTVTIGNSNIKNRLETSRRQPAMENDSLDDFWNAEIRAEGDNVDEEDGVMEKAKTRALEMAMSQKKQPTKAPTKKTSLPLSSKKIREAKIVDDDPFMRKYWENQEESPGM
jgi:hypothetical protein